MNETLNKNLTLIQEVATKALEEHKNSTERFGGVNYADLRVVDVWVKYSIHEEDLEKEFETLKENTIQKLSSLKDNESESDVVKTIKETIEKIQSEKFDQLNYVRLKQLGDSIVLES